MLALAAAAVVTWSGCEFARIDWSGAQSGNETLPCSFLRLKP